MNDTIVSKEYLSGFRASRQDISTGDIFCIQSAIVSFHFDPADNDFQRGYLAGLISYDKQGDTKRRQTG